MSWPRALGFAQPDPMAGLCIPLSWHATGSIRRAYRTAAQAGRALAGIVDRIALLDPARPVHVLSHSLGARVALCALPWMQTGQISRMVLISPAEFVETAQAALTAAAARNIEVIQTSSGENRVYDRLFELAVAGGRRRALGPGIMPDARAWHELAFARRDVLCALATLGYEIGPARARVCHWSGYTRPGVFALYKDLLCTTTPLPLAALRPALLPAAPPHRDRAQVCRRHADGAVHLRTLRPLAQTTS